VGKVAGGWEPNARPERLVADGLPELVFDLAAERARTFPVNGDEDIEGTGQPEARQLVKFFAPQLDLLP
jgi:hypothetical protein